MPALDPATMFKDHFSGHASGYASARPHYPPALFEWLAGQCDRHALAWDAGCGNGQAATALAGHFEAVFASDPSAAQIAAAQTHPHIRYAVEPAEHCSLSDASADLVCVAQAMHWFDVPRFQSEARRVLASGGIFSAWTYAQSRVTPAVDAVFDRLHDHLLDAYWPAGREHVIDGYRNLPFAFTWFADVPAFEMRCEWTLPQYFDYLRSWSASQRYLRETSTDPIALIAPDMSTAWGDPMLARVVIWPLTLHVGRSD